MERQKRTILLLGGSSQQLVAIRKAKEMGLRTVLCDYLPDNPGQREADRYYSASTTDVEAVCEIAKSEKADGILAYASDPAALPAAIVAERLGLPTNPSRSVAILGVKHLFRDFLQKNGFACPRHCTFSPDTDVNEIREKVGGFTFPIIIKPTDSSGSKGVTKLADTTALGQAAAHAGEYSRNKILIAEEFIERGFPEVIGGDIFVWDGKIVLYGEMACLRDNAGRGLIPIGEKKPAGLNPHQTERVHSELQRIVSLLGIRFGEMNIEIILDREDNVHFLELGPRAGGNMIPLQLSDAFGVDLVGANVAAAMGEKPDLRPKERPGCYMHYVLHSYKEGQFGGVEISKEIEQCVYRKVIYKKPKDRVEVFDGAGKALGIIFLHFDTAEQMQDFCKRKDELVKIKIYNMLNNKIGGG